MAESGEDQAKSLAALRAKIDAIDADMHRLLIERSTVIDSLIRTKRTERAGAAFRPGREADMMRRLVARHSGSLPLAAVEHIWRDIIATFTHLQAPYAVVIDGSADPARMRDLARFYFGFSVELGSAHGPEAVIARVAAANVLGLVPLEARPATAWWRALTRPVAPVIMTVLPFIRVSERPADLPAFVISPPLADPAPPDLTLFAVTTAAELPDDGRYAVLSRVADGGRVESLVATPVAVDAAALSRVAGAATEAVKQVGSLFRGIAVDGPSSILYQNVAEPDGAR